MQVKYKTAAGVVFNQFHLFWLMFNTSDSTRRGEMNGICPSRFYIYFDSLVCLVIVGGEECWVMMQGNINF